MASRTLSERLAILRSARQDASCALSGSAKRGDKELGSTEGSGICHAHAPDGRCVSFLNRVSSNVARARFSVDEVVRLTLEAYRATAWRGCSCPLAPSARPT
jgi:predicted DNA-binding helix-hairpin-helix protein